MQDNYIKIKQMRDTRLNILASNIRAERVRKNLSQNKLAELIDVSENTIRKIEKGNQTPSAFIVYDIANALNVSLDDLYKAVPKTKE